MKRRPSYGYELLTELEQKSGRFFTLREGTLYPILYRLEDDGLIRSKWSRGENRSSPKKIYTITPRGEETLEQLCEVWKQFSESVNELLFEEDLSQ
ncbi:Transcriptional regulator PadR-like family protein [Caprobacter fermentans]|nr:PadR family transcriptional regulator [Caproicibacter fermentans]MVB12206.1 Transcriptional regulator PadR-like family protein [Caproicibacter fermentans]